MSGRSGPRSKTGCWMCRERKIKCDEARPRCGRCTKAGRQCDYTVRDPPGPPARSSSQPLLMPKAPTPSVGLSSQSQFGQSLVDRTLPSEPSNTPAFSFPWGTQESSIIGAGSIHTNVGSDYDVQTSYRSQSDPSKYSGGLPHTAISTPSPYIQPTYESKVMSHFQENFVVSMQTKAPRWGFMNGLMHICQSDPVLMHFMLAVVGHEASTTEKQPDEQLNAIEHYRRGLVDFNMKIANGDYERHTLLIAIWLLTQYELRFAERGRDIQRHFEGFNQAILAYNYDLLPGLKPPSPAQSPSTSEKGKGPEKPSSFVPLTDPGIPNQSAFKLPRSLYSNVINRLGLWVAYMDACASTFDLDGGVMYTLLHTFDSNSLHRIFAGSREALKDIWGDEYPATEALDDLQNRPAFDAYHEFHILRFQISEFRKRSIPQVLRSSHPTSPGTQSQSQDRAIESYCQSRDGLINKINSLTQQYSSLIKIASTWPLPAQKPDRLTLNLRFIIAFFHTCVLEFYSLLADPKLPSSSSSVPVPSSRVSTPGSNTIIPYTPGTHGFSPGSVHSHPATEPQRQNSPPTLNTGMGGRSAVNTPLPGAAAQALSQILMICTIVHETEGISSLSRCNWPLFVAGIESRDVVHQSWCVERLTELGGKGVNNVRAVRVVKTVVGIRRGVGTGDMQRADLNWREWVRNGLFEEFVV